MRAGRLLVSLAVILGLALSSLGGCASSKKPKQKRTVLMTTYDDARVGKESSQAVAAQIGILDDPTLSKYVNDIGHRLLRGIPRRGFDYQFSVVDQTEPNAFALPGGYIFISRGLLALANSEDELACVIGHEITHAAHRHSATQQGMADRTITIGYRGMARMASYSRDMERDADKGGQILCAAAGYDPMGMSTFLKNLGLYQRLKVGYTRGGSFFDSHPGSVERAGVNAVRAGEMRWRRDPALGDTRASLFAKTEGLAVGQRPQTGVFEGSEFFHPDLNFKLKFPMGWRLQNSAQAVAAMTKKGDAMIFLRADMPAGDPQEVAEAWVEKTREDSPVKVKDSRPVKIGEIDGWRMKVEGSGRGGGITAYVTFIPYGAATWSVTGMTPSIRAQTYMGRTLSTARSFGPMTEDERNSIYSTKLRFATAQTGESLQALSERTGNGWPMNDTATYNAVYIDHHFKGGEPVKVFQRERYIPPPRAQPVSQ
jgi:predicted Zn-dependent protease